MVAHNETHDTEAVDETTSLLHQDGSSDNYETLNPQKHVEPTTGASEDGGDSGDREEEFPTATIRAVFPILLMGVFLANGDSSVVLATNQHIASEFNALSSAAWLLTTYTLANCSCQPLYGKLTSIFGRKMILAFCWTVFSGGCLLFGTSRTYSELLLGRALSGMGAGGMTALTSIVVADLLPVRYVAQYRAYINFTATMARSIGGPTGGWLAEVIGWRWCFVVQCPLALCGLALVQWKLPEHSSSSPSPVSQEDGKPVSKLARVDFLGALSLIGAVLTCLLSLDRGTKGASWQLLVPLGAAFAVFSTTFIIVEKRFAREPILPLELLSNRDVFTTYLIIGMQAAGQFGLLYGIPIYFQVAAGESISRAGSRIVPVVVGNAVGTVVGGHVISKTRRYKYLTLAGQLSSATCFTLMVIRWHGSTNWADSSCVFLAGLGMGISQSSTFVHLAASLENSELVLAGTTWFLSQSFGGLVGACFSTAVINGTLRSVLDHALSGLSDKDSIIRRVTSNTDYIRSLPVETRTVVVGAYIASLLYADGLSLVFVVCSLVATLTLKERRL